MEKNNKENQGNLVLWASLQESKPLDRHRRHTPPPEREVYIRLAVGRGHPIKNNTNFFLGGPPTCLLMAVTPTNPTGLQNIPLSLASLQHFFKFLKCIRNILITENSFFNWQLPRTENNALAFVHARMAAKKTPSRLPAKQMEFLRTSNCHSFLTPRDAAKRSEGIIGNNNK